MQDPKTIVLFRMGHIGDMVVAMPALWTVRRRYPNAHIILLHQEREKGKLTQGLVVFRDGLVFDEIFSYTLAGGKVSLLDKVKTILKLRARKIDLLVYMPQIRSPEQIERDRKFFTLAGVKKIVGMEARYGEVRHPAGSPLPTIAHEADYLLNTLAHDGLTPDVPPTELMNLGLSDEERAEAKAWLEAKGALGHRPIVGLGPGGKMTANHWPVERYRAAAHMVASKYPDAAFILFGGPAEKEKCAELSEGLPNVVHGEGELSIRQAAAVLEHCDVFLGNDTGITHVAASAGCRCVTVHSSRNWLGQWHPYGKGHRVFREWVPCEGCLLEDCDKGNICILAIEAERVGQAMLDILEEELSPA